MSARNLALARTLLHAPADAVPVPAGPAVGDSAPATPLAPSAPAGSAASSTTSGSHGTPGLQRLSRLLANPVRAAVLAAVRSTPGILQSDLATHLGVARATVRHHLAVLQRAQLVQVVAHRQRAAAFPSVTGDAASQAIASLQRGRTLELVRKVLAEPGKAQSDLTRELAMSRKVLRKHMDRLVPDGLVAEVDQSPWRVYYPTDRLRQALAVLDQARAPTAPQDRSPHAFSAISSFSARPSRAQDPGSASVFGPALDVGNELGRTPPGA